MVHLVYVLAAVLSLHFVPADDEARELTVVEDEIDRAMSGKKLGFLALVITTGGMREYVFYSSQPDGVRAQIKKMGRRMHGRDVSSYFSHSPLRETRSTFPT